MKRVLFLAITILGFIFIAAPTAVEYSHQIFINGKPFAKATVVNGVLAIPLEDLAKAGGGTLTLENAGLKLNGGTLSTFVGAHRVDVQGKDIGKHMPGVSGEQKAVKYTVKGESRALFAVQRAGQISSHVFQAGGKNWVPLADVAKAFGSTFTAPANLQPGQAISLNFGPNANSILGMGNFE